MRRALLRLALAALAGAALAGAAAAQPAPPDTLRRSMASPKPPGASASRLSDWAAGDEQFNLALLRARSLMARQPEQALEMLEGLLESHPEHDRLRLMVAQACRATGRLERAEALLRDLVGKFPEAEGYREELALVLLQSGRDAEAMALMESRLAGARPRPEQYEDIAELLRGANRFDLVEGVYRRGLRELPAADERGRLTLLRRLLDFNYIEERAESILRLLAGSLGELRDPALRARLVDHGELLLDGVQPGPDLLALTDSLAASPLGPELASCLAGIYLAAGDPGAFAEQILRQRGEGAQRAVRLHNAALRCLDSERGSAAARRAAARRIIETVLATPGIDRGLTAGGRLELARIRLDEDEEARLAGKAPSEDEVRALRGLLADIRRSSPGSDRASEALIAELQLLRERLGRAAEADSLLRAWLLAPERAQDPATQWGLELELGANLMALGRFDEAEAHFRSLGRRAGAPELESWARFRLAQLAALGKDTRAAQDSLAALAKEDPGSPLANDALDLALLLAEAQTWPGPVRELMASALPLALGGHPAPAARALLTFVDQFPEDPSAPGLSYFAGGLLAQAYEGRAALDAWLRLADTHPKDFRAPQALEKAARLLHRLGEDERARALVQRILESYPETPLLPGLRDLREALEAVS